MQRVFSICWLGILFTLLLLALAPASLSAQSGSFRFYYFQGAQIPLTINPRLIAVRFDPTLSAQTQRDVAANTGDVDDFDASAHAPIGGLVFVPLRGGRDPLSAVARFQAQPGVQLASPVYDFDSIQLAETDEFLARFKTTVSDAEIARLNQQNNVFIARQLPNSARVLVLKPNVGNPRSAREMANLYFETGTTEFAEPNFVIRQPRPTRTTMPSAPSGELVPNDPSFGLQWSLKNTRQFQGSLAGADINATNAWGVTQGASSIKIAVIDEGVDTSHSELGGKVLTGYNALDGSNNTAPKANDHHGTAVAGIAAANSNNGKGIAGVCWFCQILPVKVAETDSQGNWVTTASALASGIDWAWQNGADVLNNSWTSSYSDAILTAIINARTAGRGNKGSTLVFAAGNQDAGTVSFPASLNSYVIAIGASNWCDQRKSKTNNGCNNNNATWGSNYGSALDLVAPGEAIFTTCNGNQCTNGTYTYLSGTSMSTPLVAGVVGLLYSVNPNLTPDKVQQALQSGAQDIGAPGKDSETGYGRLDAHRTIAALYNLNIAVTDNRTFVAPGEILNYTISYANTGSTAMGSTVISVTLPVHTAYVSSTPAFIAQGGGKYALNLGTLGSNATGTATFRVQVQSSGAGQPITFNATIAGAFPESSMADNTATDTSIGIKSQLFLPMLVR